MGTIVDVEDEWRLLSIRPALLPRSGR
jgi:hypothetical protein